MEKVSIWPNQEQGIKTKEIKHSTILTNAYEKEFFCVDHNAYMKITRKLVASHITLVNPTKTAGCHALLHGIELS